MARYFFHTHHDFAVLDPVGREMINLDAAENEAMLDARRAAAREVKGLGTLSLSHRIEVTNALGAIVATIRLADAVRVRP
jgi:hypothetical protein